MKNREKNPRTWLMALAVVLAAVLAAVIPILLIKEKTPEIPTAEDLSVLDKLRPLLGENQLINAEYELFAKSDPDHQKVSKVIATCNDLLQLKKTLLDSLEMIKPSSYYLKVYQLLVESVTSDIKLLDLQKSFVEMLNVNSKVLAEEKQQRILINQEMLTMTKTELKIKALPALRKLHDTLVYYDKWFNRNEAARRTVRSNSIEAIRLLNDELRTKKLPYVHINVYEEVDPFENGDF